jgi:hypothetical protein
MKRPASPDRPPKGANGVPIPDPEAESLKIHRSPGAASSRPWPSGEPPQVSPPRWSELKRRVRGRLARKAQARDVIEHDRQMFHVRHPGHDEALPIDAATTDGEAGG